jgi:hypothetical protein
VGVLPVAFSVFNVALVPPILPAVVAYVAVAELPLQAAAVVAVAALPVQLPLEPLTFPVTFPVRAPIKLVA